MTQPGLTGLSFRSEPAAIPPSEAVTLGELSPAEAQNSGLLESFEGQVIGHYRVERLIGEGGMGVVYLARQLMPEREVALKLIRPGFTTEATLTRFRFEAEVLGRLQHPGIAQIYEAGLFDPPSRREAGLPPVPFFAMEYVRGVDLREFVEKHRLGTDERLQLVAKVCDAIEHAHTKGVIHRDLKPGNILVDQSGQPKVLDFGTARLTKDDRNAGGPHTHAGQILGTVLYMSPEQVTGEVDVDTRSDVYSLGVVAFELLAGCLPHDLRGRMMHQAMATIRDAEPTRLSSINRIYRGDIETIIATALEKDVRRRYQSAGALAADIRRFLKDEPILARPASPAYQARKFIKRNRVLVGAAAVSVIVGVAAFTAVSIALARAIRAEESAVKSLAEAQNARASEAAARARAETQRMRAEDEADTARRVNEFMNGVLSAVNPDTGHRLVTVREVLDRSALELDHEFDARPVVRAQARLSIAQSYLGLGEPAVALSMAERAVAELQANTDESDRRLVMARAVLATAHQNLGNLDAAEEIFTALVNDLQRIDGPDALETLTQTNNLAQILAMKGKIEESEILLRRAVKGLEASPGPESAPYTDAAGNLAIVLQWRSRLKEAMALQERVVELCRKVRGPEHPSTLIAINNLASMYADDGRPEDALHGYQEGLALSKKVLGPDHPDTLVSLTNVAGALTDLKRFTEAEVAYREALETRERKLGATHPDTIQNMVDLSLNLEKQGRRDDAVALLQSGVERAAQSEQDGLEEILATFTLGRMLTESGRAAEGEPLLLDAERRQVAATGDATWRLGAIRASLGVCQAQLGKTDEAVASLTAGYALLKEHLGDRATWTTKAARGLADIFLARGDAASERLWRERANPTDAPKTPDVTDSEKK